MRYEVKADFPGNPENISGYGKVSWLLHLFSVRFAYNEEKFTWKLRLGWKSFRDDSQIEEKPVKNKPETRKQKEAKKKSVQVSKSRSEEKVDSKPDEKVNSQKPTEKVQSIAEGGSKKEIQIKTEIKHLTDKSEIPEEPSVFERIFNKIKAIFEKIKYTFYQICDKIKVICETKEKITNFLENEVHRTAFAGAVKELVWLKRFLKPKKVKTDIHFGFEDPYHTGLALAACGMIYPFVGEYMNIRPDFENQVLEGTFYIKGRLRMIYLVILAVRLFFDRNIRTLYKDIREII